MSKKKHKALKSKPVQAEIAQTAKPRSNRKTFLILAAVIVTAIALGSYFASSSKSYSFKAGQFKDYNVVLVTLDTLRADHLPSYGYSAVKTPNLDRLAAESIQFDRAFSHAPLTLPSHTSILTGRLPISHGVRDNAGYHLDDSETTLAEILKDRGYSTSAFVSSFVLDSVFNINQGFDFYYDNFDTAEFQGLDPRAIERRADETLAEAQLWIDKNKDKKFFTWVHFYDPHDPYEPPEPYRSEYTSVPYDGEVAYTDWAVGELLSKLEQTGVMSKTIFIVTADHGEGLGEHGESRHGLFIYNSTVHVPLLIHLPGEKNGRVDQLVSHIDLTPTILDFLGIPVSKSIQGASLIPLLNGKEKSERFAYSESLYSSLHYGWAPLESVTSKQYKYIHAPRPELFDLEKDFSESSNLASQKGPLAKAMNSELQEIKDLYTNKNSEGPGKMDPEVEEKLRSLGYITSSSADKNGSGSQIDPKDKVHIAVAVQDAAGAALIENYPLAIRLIEPVLQEQDNMSEALYVAGVSHASVGNYDKAIDYLMRTIALVPDHAMAQYNLGAAYLMKNNLKDAEYWLQKVVKASPKLMNAQIKLGQTYMMAKQPEKAAPHFAIAIQYYEDALKKSGSSNARGETYASLAEVQFSAGDLKNAEQNLRKAIELEPTKPMLHYNLAQILEALNNKNSAILEYEEEVKVNPANFRAFTNAGILYYEAQRFNDAARCFQKSVELNPSDPRGYLQLAAVYKKMGKDREAEDLLRVVKERGGALN
jgi:arylsulfatase A-like enzyme/Flp pilus assembly protein TadD